MVEVRGVDLGLMRSVWGFVKLAFVLVWYLGELVLLRPRTRPERAQWLHRLCARVVSLLGIRVTVEGEVSDEGGALISNHLGYLDIFVYAALHRCVYCSKAEIRKWPVIGWIAMMAGTVFIERGRGGSALKASEVMGKAFKAGLPVMFFPEGTTSNGDEVLPFHSGLLQQAMVADAPVWPARVSYTLDEPNGPGITVRDDVHYWGDVNILKHLFRFCSLRGVHAHVRIGAEPVAFDTANRKEAAVEAREAVLRLGDERVIA